MGNVITHTSAQAFWDDENTKYKDRLELFLDSVALGNEYIFRNNYNVSWEDLDGGVRGRIEDNWEKWKAAKNSEQ